LFQKISALIAFKIVIESCLKIIIFSRLEYKYVENRDFERYLSSPLYRARVKLLN